MSVSIMRNQGVRRGSALRAGLVAVSAAAAAALCSQTTARADISGFSAFSPINTAGTFTTLPNYSSDGVTFNTTDGGGGEAVSGYDPVPQLITSFNAQFTFNASAGADGTAFVIQNQGTTALGGGGGSVGYAGTPGVTPSVALKLNIYGTNSVNLGVNGTLTTNTNATTLTGGPVTVNVSYYGTTLSITETNSATKGSASQSFSVNVPTTLGSNTALIGFSSGTGGVASTQQVGNFRFISNTTYSPIALTSSSYNEDMVVEKGAPLTGATANITASMDQGTFNLNNNSWYEKGYNAAAPTTGLPTAGSTFTSQGDPNHVYTMAPSYVGNDALLVGATGTTTASPSSGTLTFATPQVLRALSFLTASGNGPQGLQLTINYADGAPSSTINDLVSPDWFGQGNIAYDSSGRVVPGATNVSSSFNSVGSANPNLWEADVLLPDTTDPISSVLVSNDTGGGRAAIFAVSGAAVIGTDTLLYTGTGTPAASFDTSGSKNYTLGGVAAAFVVGDSIVYDDSATGSHTITVQSQGVSPTLLSFNNSSSNYTFIGGPITKAAGVSVNGSGNVTFNNSVSLTGATTLNAGALNIGGAYNTTGFSLVSGASLNIAAGGTLVNAADLVDNGTVNIVPASVTFGSLSGAGLINLNGAGGSTVTATGANTAFTGSFGGSGTFNLSAGTYTPTAASAMYSLTGGINVGTVNGSNASLVIQDGGGSFGTTATSGMLTATLGPSGTLTSPITTDGAWGGKIVLAAGVGVANITSGASGSLEVDGPILGVGPVLLAAGNSSQTTVNLNSASNTYTGETQLSPATTSGVNNVVNINANNAISPQSGVNFVSPTNAGAVQLNLNNYNQSIAYLSGSTSNPGSTYITANGATLTINGGNASGAPALFNVPIQGSLNLVKTGTGNQLLVGSNSYNGVTVISGGTLTALNSSALSNSQVNLSGGTLSLATVGTTVVGTPQISGFAGMTLTKGGGGNGPSVSGSTLTLTDTTNSEANAAFSTTPVTLSSVGFVASFLYSEGGGADGIAFIIQNDPRGNAAVGGAGGQLGYTTGSGGALNGTNAAIQNSAGILFNIYGGSTTALGINGALGTFQGANLYSTSSPNPVTIVYNANTQLLSESITDPDSGTTNTFTYSGVNFSTLLNGSSGYVGFTGATGGVNATQSVSNFTFGTVSAASTSLANMVVATNGTSVIQLGAGPAGSTAAIGGLTINSGAKVLISTSTGSTQRGVLQTPSLSIAATGMLDLAGNDLDVAASGLTIGQATAYLKAGYNNGNWNGSGGIASSAAASNPSHLTALGAIINDSGANTNASTGTPLYGNGGGLFSTLDGSTPPDGDILIKYTYYGDTNLDGAVDGTDYAAIDNGFLHHLSGWFNGDFNYDNVIDGSDYTLMDNAFNQQGGSLGSNPAAQLATSTAQISGSSSAVPEPASLSLLAIGVTALLGRRRRQN